MGKHLYRPLQPEKLFPSENEKQKNEIKKSKRAHASYFTSIAPYSQKNHFPQKVNNKRTNTKKVNKRQLDDTLPPPTARK